MRAPPPPSFPPRVQGELINLKTDKEGHVIQSKDLILKKMVANFVGVAACDAFGMQRAA